MVKICCLLAGDGYTHHYWQLLAGAGTANTLRGLQAAHVWRRLRLDTAREHGRTLVDRPADPLHQARATAGR